jgi:hypothetical protein
VATRDRLDQLGRKIRYHYMADVEVAPDPHPDGVPAISFADTRWEKFIGQHRGKPEKDVEGMRKAARVDAGRAATGRLLTESWIAVEGEPMGPWRMLNWDAEQVGVGMRAAFRGAWQLRDVHAQPAVTVVKTSQSYRTRRSEWLLRGPHDEPVAAVGGASDTDRRDAKRYKTRAITNGVDALGTLAVRRASVFRREAQLEDPAGTVLATVTFDKHDRAVLHIPGAISDPMRLVALGVMAMMYRAYGPEASS